MNNSVVPPEIEAIAQEAGRSPASNDWMIVWGAGLAVGLAATAYIYYRFRRRPRKLHSHGTASLLGGLTDHPHSHSHDHSHHSHSRRRRRGRRNPTLAQTGGLPPVRHPGATPAQPQ